MNNPPPKSVTAISIRKILSTVFRKLFSYSKVCIIHALYQVWEVPVIGMSLVKVEYWVRLSLGYDRQYRHWNSNFSAMTKYLMAIKYICTKSNELGIWLISNCSDRPCLGNDTSTGKKIVQVDDKILAVREQFSNNFNNNVWEYQ